MDEKKISADQVEKRRVGTDLAAAAVSGASGGAAGAIAAQLIAKVTQRQTDAPPPKK